MYTYITVLEKKHKLHCCASLRCARARRWCYPNDKRNIQVFFNPSLTHCLCRTAKESTSAARKYESNKSYFFYCSHVNVVDIDRWVNSILPSLHGEITCSPQLCWSSVSEVERVLILFKKKMILYWLMYVYVVFRRISFVDRQQFGHSRIPAKRNQRTRNAPVEYCRGRLVFSCCFFSSCNRRILFPWLGPWRNRFASV